jgi:hypothetical protein
VATVHMIVGGLLVLGFLASLVLNGLALTGRQFPWSQYVSFGAAALLLIQVLLGFSLLGSDHDNSGWHYVFAILALLSLGLEHGYSRARPTAEERYRWGAVANAVTLALVLITYIIGQSNS